MDKFFIVGMIVFSVILLVLVPLMIIKSKKNYHKHQRISRKQVKLFRMIVPACEYYIKNFDKYIGFGVCHCHTLIGGGGGELLDIKLIRPSENFLPQFFDRNRSRSSWWWPTHGEGRVGRLRYCKWVVENFKD